MVERLNIRHKLSLCATLVCVGLLVLLGVGVRTIVGIGCLGIAFSWAFGSNYRLVHWLCVVFGLLLLTLEVANGLWWLRNKPEFIKNKQEMIENDRNLLQLEEEALQHETDKQARRKDQEELGRDARDLSDDQLDLVHLENEGALRHALRNDWGAVVGGILLLSAGLGLVIGAKPAPHNMGKTMRTGY